MAFNNSERRAVLCLASILAFRMLGLFMIFPVFSVYATNYKYSTATLIGLTLGIYGFTQGLLQLPASILSDRIGRKPIILSGLLLFAIGSTVAAMAQNIYFLMIGRALQGAGAIGSTLMALAADLTSTENRTQAMATLGVTIGASFCLAMTIGPFINSWLHLSGLFWLTAIFALIGIIIFQYGVLPQPKASIPAGNALKFTQSFSLFRLKPELLKLNLSVFILHMLLTANFMVIPFLFMSAGLSSQNQSQIYLLILFIALLISLPIIFLAERKHFIKLTILGSILCIGCSEFLFTYYTFQKVGIIIVLLLFFTGFTLMETILPSLISKVASAHQRGSAMGFYSSFQFLGIFLGGLFSGLIKNHCSNKLVFFSAFFTCLLWFTYMIKFKQPSEFKIKRNYSVQDRNVHI